MDKISLSEHFKKFRVKTALKVVIAGTICILINNIFHLDLGYFAALFCMLFLILSHGEVLKSGGVAFIGSIVSGLVSIIISYLLIDSKAAYLIVMSAWIFLVLAVLYRYFLAMLVSGVVATMVMYDSIFSSVTEVPEIFWNYMIQFGMSIVVSAFVDNILWPHRTRNAFQVTLKTVFQDFSELFKSYSQDAPVKNIDHSSFNVSLSTFGNLVAYINRMQKEERSKDFPMELYIKMITFARGTFLKMEVLEEQVMKEHDFMKDERVKENVEQIFALISESYSTFAKFVGTEELVDIKMDEIDQRLTNLHDIYKEMHEIEGKDDRYFDDLHAFGGILPILEDITDKLGKIAEAINIFHSGGYRRMMEERVSHTKAVEEKKAKTIFLIDSDSTKAAIKTVIIFLFLMLGEAVFGLPGGGQVIFFAILFGVIPNLGQAYMKSRFALYGVFFGLMYSFISLTVILAAPHFLLVIALYVLGTFAAGYVASSSQDIAVAGLQAGLLFPFGILLTTGPDVDISDAFTRFLALLSAVFIGLIVQHTLWPSNPYNSLLQKISKSISLSGQIFSKIVTTEVSQKEKVESLVLPLAATLPTTASLLHDAEYVIREHELHREEFIQIIESIELIYADLETIKRTVFGSSYVDVIEENRKTMGSINESILAVFNEVSEQIKTKNDYTIQIKTLRKNMDDHITEYRKTGEWREFDPRGIEDFVLINNTLDSLLDSLHKISTNLNSINGIKSSESLQIHTSEILS